jgi:CheY-like chemotaxis protein
MIRDSIPMSEYTVLCVDDDEAICELYQAAFPAWGHRAVTSMSPLQALNTIGNQDVQFDAILLDYEMPEMNGAELAAEIKRQHPNLPIMMVSGNAEIVRHAPQFVDITIAKGSELALLISQIENLIVSYRNPKPAQPFRWTVADTASA